MLRTVTTGAWQGAIGITPRVIRIRVFIPALLGPSGFLAAAIAVIVTASVIVPVVPAVIATVTVAPAAVVIWVASPSTIVTVVAFVLDVTVLT